jgi:thiol-disulfide isomerase/thioredoxin
MSIRFALLLCLFLASGPTLAGEAFSADEIDRELRRIDGLYSGAWLLKADPSSGRLHDIAIAFAATGVAPELPEGVHPTFNAVEERLMRLAFDIGDAPRPDRGNNDAEPRPFDESADAMTDVEAALLASKASGKPVLLVLGGNWCHDSRGLAAKFALAPLAEIIDRGFHQVFVDVGYRDRNLGVAKRFGVETLLGTPTILIISPDGALINADSVHDWRTADSRSMTEAIAYFSAYAADPAR